MRTLARERAVLVAEHGHVAAWVHRVGKHVALQAGVRVGDNAEHLANTMTAISRLLINCLEKRVQN